MGILNFCLSQNKNLDLVLRDYEFFLQFCKCSLGVIFQIAWDTCPPAVSNFDSIPVKVQIN